MRSTLQKKLILTHKITRPCVWASLTISLLFGGCAAEDSPLSASSSLDAKEVSPESGEGLKADRLSPRVGILLTSHGDIDNYEEIEPYIRSAFLKNVGHLRAQTAFAFAFL